MIIYDFISVNSVKLPIPHAASGIFQLHRKVPLFFKLLSQSQIIKPKTLLQSVHWQFPTSWKKSHPIHDVRVEVVTSPPRHRFKEGGHDQYREGSLETLFIQIAPVLPKAGAKTINGEVRLCDESEQYMPVKQSPGTHLKWQIGRILRVAVAFLKPIVIGPPGLTESLAPYTVTKHAIPLPSPSSACSCQCPE